MSRIVIGAALSGVAVMVWGFIFWAGGGAELGFSHLDAASETAVRELLDTQIPATGTYFVPDQSIGSMDEWTARHLAGPLAFVHVTKAGMNPMSPLVYVLGFLHMTLTALLLSMLLRVVPAEKRLGFVLLVGVVVAFWSNISDPIWFYQPWGYHLVTSVYDIVSFGIMGLILRRFVRES